MPGPWQSNPIMRQIIAIEGALGAGKTTLAKALIPRLNPTPHLVLERFNNNPFLSDFYAGVPGKSLSTELYFLLDRVAQLQSLNTTGITIADYAIQKCLWFAQLNLSPSEWAIFLSVYETIVQPEMLPTKTVYIAQSDSEALTHVQQRGRTLEKHISSKYLHQVNQWYSHRMQSLPENSMIIQSALLRTDSETVINNVIDFIVKN